MSIIDNEKQTLEQALRNSLPQAESVDILTAYFYFSGFSMLINQLKDKKIRILVGKAIDPSRIKELSNILKRTPDVDLAGVTDINFDSKTRSAKRSDYIKSFAGMMNSELVGSDFDDADGRRAFEIFEQKMRDGSLEIKMTSIPNHAKVYILSNSEQYSLGGDYRGCVFHGSNNFTYSGLRGQGEVATVDRSNERYDEFLNYFNSLWDNANNTIDIQTEKANDLITSIENDTWIHSNPSPYDIYARILFEYYGHEESNIKTATDITDGRFSNLSYQLDAIKESVFCINKHHGVIIADVVGLGKSVIASAIAHNLNMERTVVIAPPHLVPQWNDYGNSFKLRNSFIRSRGKMEDIFESFYYDKQPTLYIIDEAHYYKNQNTKDYILLHKLIRSNPDNRVLLLSATPYNNHPKDIFSLLKLFQVPGKSTLCPQEGLNRRFSALISEYKTFEKISREQGITQDVKDGMASISERIREIIEPVVIRRSRIDLKEIKKYADDLAAQGIEFPEVADPILLTYDFGEEINNLYLDTIDKMSGSGSSSERVFSGALYMPFNYIVDKEGFYREYKDRLKSINLETTQRNMASFAKRLFATRLESSKEAFRLTLSKMIESIEYRLRLWHSVGVVPLLSNKEPMDLDEIEEIVSAVGSNQRIDGFDDSTLPVPSHLFSHEYIENLESDYQILRDIQKGWFENGHRDNDPKLEKVIECISRLRIENPKRKIVIFSQFKDTAEYVAECLVRRSLRVMLYTGSSKKSEKTIVSKNFDASWPIDQQEDDYDIIVATDALSEGFNLHRAGVVINYDIPYNPTRVIQRIGRINRINKKMFERLYIYNFFPSVIGEEHTNIARISNLKMLLINTIIGGDTKILSPDENLQSFLRRQFNEQDQENQERSWDNSYRNDFYKISKDKDFLNRIKHIPARARIARDVNSSINAIMYAKKSGNNLFMSAEGRDIAFLSPEKALSLLKADSSEEPKNISDLPKDSVILKARDEILRERVSRGALKNRQNALGVIDTLRHYSGFHIDYLLDLKETIEMYDDLCDGEIAYIGNIDIDKVLDGRIDEVINELKVAIPELYLEDIRQKSIAMNNGDDAIVFIEEFVA